MTLENIRDVPFCEDTTASRTGSGPANLATIRPPSSRPSKMSATCTFPKVAAITPRPQKPSASMASIRADRTFTEHAGALMSRCGQAHDQVAVERRAAVSTSMP